MSGARPETWRRTVEPAQLAISLTSDLKPFIRIPGTDTALDTLNANLIAAATDWAEGYMGRALITQTWLYGYRRFPDGPDFLLAAPLVSTGLTVKYYDDTNTLQTVAASIYTVDTEAQPGRVSLNLYQIWPAVVLAQRPDAVQITFTAGYGATSDSVPTLIRMAIALLAAQWLDDPSSAPGAAVMAALAPYRIKWF